MSKSQEFTEPTGSNLSENIQQIGLSIPAAIATLHPITNAIFAGYSAWNSRKSRQQLYTMITHLSKRLEALEDYDMEFLASDEFKELLYKVSQKAIIDLREQKAALFGDFLAGAAKREHPPISDSFMMSEILDKLEIEHIDFLSKMSSRTFSAEEQMSGWKAEDEDLKLLGLDETRFLLLSDYLSNLGLVSRLEQFKVDDTGHLIMWREYYLSRFGKLLLDTLSS